MLPEAISGQDIVDMLRSHSPDAFPASVSIFFHAEDAVVVAKWTDIYVQTFVFLESGDALFTGGTGGRGQTLDVTGFHHLHSVIAIGVAAAEPARSTTDQHPCR